MINNGRFRQLIKKAKGDMNQKDFAEKCGISEFTISRFMSTGVNNTPNETTLSKIADASEGRVTLSELLYCVGRYDRADELLNPDFESHDYADSPLYQKMKNVVDDLITDLAGKRKYSGVDDWLDTFDMLYGPKGLSYRQQSEIQLEHEMLSKRNFNGSAYCTPVTFVLADDACTSIAFLVFAVFYVKTTKTDASDKGIVILDKAFDLATLDSLHAEDLSEIYEKVAQTNGAQLSDFDLCYYEKSPEKGERKDSC